MNLTGWKVIYNNIIYRVMEVRPNFNALIGERKKIEKPKFLDVIVINEDGEIVLLYDEAWCFQFIRDRERGDGNA